MSLYFGKYDDILSILSTQAVNIYSDCQKQTAPLDTNIGACTETDAYTDVDACTEDIYVYTYIDSNGKEKKQYFTKNDIYVLDTPPRKIFRRLRPVNVTNELAVPPYAVTARTLVPTQDKILFTLSYIGSLLTNNINQLKSKFDGKLILSAEDTYSQLSRE